MLHAVYYDDFQMARFLYSVTPLEDLTLPHNGKVGASIIYECINRQNFGKDSRNSRIDLMWEDHRLYLNRLWFSNQSLYLLINIILVEIQYDTTDIPLDLLKHCPRLAITAISDKESPVHALSCCPKSMFRSGFQLGFWQRWLYDCEYISPSFNIFI